MLSHALRAAAGYVGPIELVGSASGQSGTAGSTASVDVSGIDIAVGDVIVAYFGAGNMTVDRSVTITGFTQPDGDQYRNSDFDAIGAWGYKVVTGTPDTSVDCTFGESALDRGGAVLVFRNVNTTSPIEDSTATTGFALINPPAVTITNSGCVTIAAGVQGDNAGNLANPTNYTGMTQWGGVGFDSRGGLCYRLDTPTGTENPGTLGGTNSVIYATCVATIALTPA